VSSSSTQTNYSVSIDLESGGSQASSNFDIPQALGVTDSDVLAFIAHLRAFTWPSGIYSAFTVNKWSQTSVSYTTDMAADPPAFT
jgi:hypothetical protein